MFYVFVFITANGLTKIHVGFSNLSAGASFAVLQATSLLCFIDFVRSRYFLGRGVGVGLGFGTDLVPGNGVGGLGVGVGFGGVLDIILFFRLLNYL